MNSVALEILTTWCVLLSLLLAIWIIYWHLAFAALAQVFASPVNHGDLEAYVWLSLGLCCALAELAWLLFIAKSGPWSRRRSRSRNLLRIVGGIGLLGSIAWAVRVIGFTNGAYLMVDLPLLLWSLALFAPIAGLSLKAAEAGR